jgi:hypothetical protein
MLPLFYFQYYFLMFKLSLCQYIFVEKATVLKKVAFSVPLFIGVCGFLLRVISGHLGTFPVPIDPKLIPT